MQKINKKNSGEQSKSSFNIPSKQTIYTDSSLGLDTIIPTTTGYKTMETIEVGDYVFGLDNNPVKVTQVHEIHKSMVYELVFANDFYITTIISDEIHRFPVTTKLRISPLDTDFFKSVQCKDLQVYQSIIEGKRQNTLISKTKLNKEKLVRCITIDSDYHIFLVSDTKTDWNGGNTYTGPAIYTYSTTY